MFLTVLCWVVGIYCLLMWVFTLKVGLDHKEEWAEASWFNKITAVLFSPLTFPVFLFQESKESEAIEKEAHGTINDWKAVMDMGEAVTLTCETFDIFRNYLKSPSIKDKILVPPPGPHVVTSAIDICCQGCIVDLSEVEILTSSLPAFVITGLKNCLLGAELTYPSTQENLEFIIPVSTIGSESVGFVASIPNSYTLLAGLSVSKKESNEEV